MPSDAQKHASDALEHWQAGRLAEAETLYRLAIRESASEPDYEASDYHTQLGQVLASLGRDQDAEFHLRHAIEIACAGNDDSSSIVGIARYFCAEYLVSRKPAEALAVLAPSLARAGSVTALLHFVEATALWALERRDDARTAATQALHLAKNEEQRDRMRARLRELPGWDQP